MKRNRWLLLPALVVVPAISILFIPPLSKPIVQSLVESTLGHRLSIDTYFFNPMRLQLSGRFDDNSTIEIDAADLLLSSRHARVRLNANAKLFSKLAETDLPNIPFSANAEYRDNAATITATTLEGTVHADMDMSTLAYTYQIKNLSVGTFLRLQELPLYASGTLNAVGKGSAADEFHQDANITSYNINLQSPLLSSLKLPSLKTPVSLTTEIHFQFDHASLLKLSADIASKPVALSIHDTTFDINTGALTFNVFISNNSIGTIPVKQFNTLAMGTMNGNSIAVNAAIETETYRALLSGLNYDLKQQRLTTEYRFSTIASAPINLTGNNTLYGHADYQPDKLHLTVSSKAVGVPLTIELNAKHLTVISNNIPLAPLFEIVNMKPLSTGNIDLNATADLNGTYPRIEALVNSANLLPSASIADELNITEPGHLDLALQGDETGYRAHLAMQSQFFKRLDAEAKMDPNRLTASIKATATDFTLPFYASDSMQLVSHVDLNRSEISGFALTTPYSSIQVPSFHYGKKIHGSLTYSIGGLNRFFKEANASQRAEGNATVSKENGVMLATLHTKYLGDYAVKIAGESGTLNGRGLALQPLLASLGYPHLIKGDLSLEGDLSPGSLTLNLHSDRLEPLEDLNATLRPFPFDTVVNVSRCSKRFVGKVTISTPYDRLELNGLDLDLFAQRFGANYIMTFSDTGHSAIRLPSEIIGKRLHFRGNFALTPLLQSVSFKSDPVQLAPSLHAVLEHNATSPLPVTLDMNATHTADSLIVHSDIRTPYFQIDPLHARYDLNSSFVEMHAFMKTKRYLGNTSLDFNGTYDTDALKDASLGLQTNKGELHLTHLELDPANRLFKSDAKLLLAPLNRDYKGEPAVIDGKLYMHSAEHNASLHTELFGGKLSATANNALLYVEADHVDLPSATAFFAPAAQLRQGNVDARILLDTPSLLEQNLSTLQGGVDIVTHDIVIDGIEFDSYLETLRNTQDLSLFQGSVGDLPIIRSVKNIPDDILKTKKIETHIPNARAAIAVKGGLARCEDCAFATLKHRVAFAGDMNITSQRFNHFYFGLINPEGCPYFMQQIKGPLAHPEVNVAASGVKVVGGAVVSLASNVTDAASWLTGAIYRITSATGDVISYVPLAGSAVDKTLTTVTGTLDSSVKTVSGCTPFYLGTVPHPKPKK